MPEPVAHALQKETTVPLGLFLSGDLDSAALASYVHRVGRPLDSFTVHFGDENVSERKEAARAAHHFGLRHHELEVKPGPDFTITVDRLGEIFDEPFSDPSVIPTTYLCEFSRRTVTVALSSHGGNELFAGHPAYLADRRSGYYRLLPKLLRTLIETTSNKNTSGFPMNAFLSVAGRPQPQAHFGGQEIFFPQEKPALYTNRFHAAVKSYAPEESFVEAFKAAGTRQGLEKMLYVDQRTHLLDNYLVKMDRLSMAHSLQVRVPMLDPALVEFAAQIPMNHKLRGSTTKFPIQQLMKDRLPQGTPKAQKRSFPPPLARWLAKELNPWAKEVLSPERVRRTGVLDSTYPQRLLEEHTSQKRDHHRRLWALVNFMQWFEKYGGFGLDL